MREKKERPARILTTNLPTLVYYFAPEFWGQPGPDRQFTGDFQVMSIEVWDVAGAGGPEPYLRSVMAAAERDGVQLYVMVTEPELHEKDPSGTLEAVLRREFRQVKSYPAWVGPKDQTVFLYAYRP